MNEEIDVVNERFIKTGVHGSFSLLSNLRFTLELHLGDEMVTRT